MYAYLCLLGHGLDLEAQPVIEQRFALGLASDLHAEEVGHQHEDRHGVQQVAGDRVERVQLAKAVEARLL